MPVETEGVVTGGDVPNLHLQRPGPLNATHRWRYQKRHDPVERHQHEPLSPTPSLPPVA
jgi:hypothetical protein